MKKVEKVDIIVWSFMILFFGAILTLVGIALYELRNMSSFCEEKHPSIQNYNSLLLEKNYGTQTNMEPGYIKCCRAKYEYHEYVKDCKNFVYLTEG